jgi:hypothetical protein
MITAWSAASGQSPASAGQSRQSELGGGGPSSVAASKQKPTHVEVEPPVLEEEEGAPPAAEPVLLELAPLLAPAPVALFPPQAT